LTLAAERGHTNVVHLLITKGKANVEATGRNGRTALMWAAMHGCTDVVNFLVTRGNANVGATDEEGKTALTLAAENGHTDVVDLLQMAVEHPNNTENLGQNSKRQCRHYR
jgi:ankyrin repeat protein